MKPNGCLVRLADVEVQYSYILGEVQVHAYAYVNEPEPELEETLDVFELEDDET